MQSAAGLATNKSLFRFYCMLAHGRYSFSSRRLANAVEYNDAFRRRNGTIFHTILSKTIKVHREANRISQSFGGKIVWLVTFKLR